MGRMMEIDPATIGKAAGAGGAAFTGWFGWLFRRQIKRLDRIEQMAMAAATMDDVEREIDQRMGDPIRELRQDIRDMRAELHDVLKLMPK